MSYEIDILAVGEESKSGDAIALRFGNFLFDPNDQTVVVIDGGFRTSGEELIKLIGEYYNTDHVDLVISTHPDSDHINGLHVILEQLKVDELWMHTPWNLSDDVKKIAEEIRLPNPSKLKKSLQAAYDLEKLAIKKGIHITEPFQGLSKFDDKVHVLGPSLDYYFELSSQIDQSASMSLSSLFTISKESISELWHRDMLKEPDVNAVSARNNSSVITLVQLDEHFLFVGDSGVSALTHAANYADSKGYSLASDVKYQQVPHHGSKRNLGPTILDRIIGPILSEGQTIDKVAIISVAPNHDKHPSKRVKNALVRRGTKVTQTCGNSHCYRSLDVPLRPGWGPITYEEFCPNYEEE